MHKVYISCIKIILFRITDILNFNINEMNRTLSGQGILLGITVFAYVGKPE